MYALEHHHARLAEDHANARALAEGLAVLPGLELDLATVVTNIVLFRVKTGAAPALATQLDAAGVRMLAVGPNTIRAVTSLMVKRKDIAAALKIVGRLLAKN